MSRAGHSGRDVGVRVVTAVAAAVVVALLVVRYLAPLVVTLAAGAALYYTCAPLCGWLGRHRVPRGASVLGVALVLVAAVALAAVALLPRVYTQLLDFAGGLPSHLAELERRLSEAGLLGEGTDPRVRRAVDALADRAGALVGGGLSRGAGLAAATLGSATAVLLGVFLGFYLLLGAASLTRELADWFPPERRERWVRFGRESSRAVGGFVRARVLAAMFIGASYLVAFLVLGLNQALLLAVVAGLFDLVPVIGPLLAAIPAMLVAAFQGFGKVLAVVALMLVAQQIESGVLDPLLAGRMVRLPAAVMVLAIATGSAAAGIPGMLVAVPLVAAARAALAIFYRERWDEPPA